MNVSLLATTLTYFLFKTRDAYRGRYLRVEGVCNRPSVDRSSIGVSSRDAFFL